MAEPMGKEEDGAKFDAEPSTDTDASGLSDFDRDLIANPEKYKKLWGDKARAEHPEMTEEQHEASWQQLAHQFGL
jgi:hypothetical protein